MHGYAGDNMSADKMSRYMGVMRCVDNIFYDGGYDPDDSERIAVMNDVLERNGLPLYNEVVYSKIDNMMASKSDGFNFEIFLDSSVTCLNMQEVMELEKKYDVTAEY